MEDSFLKVTLWGLQVIFWDTSKCCTRLEFCKFHQISVVVVVVGLAQCTELCKQLRGECGKRQVPGAKVALQHNLGLGGAVVVALYQLGFPNQRRWEFNINWNFYLWLETTELIKIVFLKTRYRPVPSYTSAVKEEDFKAAAIFEEMEKKLKGVCIQFVVSFIAIIIFVTQDFLSLPKSTFRNILGYTRVLNPRTRLDNFNSNF